MEEKNPEMKSTKLNMYLIFGVLFLVGVCIFTLLVLFYLYRKDQDNAIGVTNQDSQQEEDNSNEAEAGKENEISTVAFAGDFVSADVPDGWTVTEYQDGAGGYGLLSDGTYDGLTAITVSNPAGDVVFKIEGVNGIGGTEECSQVYQFADTEASYVQDRQTVSFDLSGTTPPVVDLSGQNYVEFDLLGMEGRFLGNAAYWNVATAGSGTFNPACNMLQVALENVGLSFDYTISGQTYTDFIYMPNITTDFQYAQAAELAEILSSLTVN